MNEPITKPSRLNRRKKKRWKITDLVANGLTDCYREANLFLPSQKVKDRRDNLFSIGVNTPQSYVAFLCASFCAALSRIFIMTGCFGHSKEWLATNTQFITPLQPVAHAVISMIGGLNSSVLESPQ